MSSTLGFEYNSKLIIKLSMFKVYSYYSIGLNVGQQFWMKCNINVIMV